MEDFYQWLADLKKSKNLSYTALGEVINKNGNAMRMAVVRESLSDLEKDKITQMFDTGAQKTPQEDARLEDIIAKRVLEEVGPFIGQMTDRVLSALLELTMSLDRVRSEQEDIKHHQETINRLQKELRESQEKTYDLIESKQ